MSLDPGVHACGDDGVQLWLPGGARAANTKPESPSPAGSSRAAEVLVGSLERYQRIEDGEAGAFAAFFAMDYLSWDEDDPGRRPEVLRRYLADSRACTLGWSGAGRQRADSPVPGRLERRSDVVVFVEVTLRVTPYARVCPPTDPPVAHTDEPAHVIAPSSAPASDPDSWTHGRAWTAAIAVPVTRDQHGHLVVDLDLIPATPSA